MNQNIKAIIAAVVIAFCMAVVAFGITYPMALGDAESATLDPAESTTSYYSAD